MQRYFKIIAVALVCSAAIVGTFVWSSSQPLTTSLNYKLTVEIDDNGVVRHGEGVIGVHFRSNGGNWRRSQAPTWTITPRGEAFTVDLGARGTLFVLLTADSVPRKGYRSPLSTEAGFAALSLYYGDSFSELPPDAEGKRQIELFAQKRIVLEIARNELPMLARFRDENDPSTAERVDPDQLEASFGPGVRFKRASIQLTTQPVTRTLAKRLSWFTSAQTGTDPKWSLLPAQAHAIVNGLFTPTAEHGLN